MKNSFSDNLFGWPFFVIIIGWLIGMFLSSLIPNDTYILITIILSTVIGTIFSIAIFFRIKTTHQKKLHALAFLPILYISTYITLTFAMPMLFKPIFSNQEIREFKVLDKDHNYKTACYKVDIGIKLKLFPTRVLCLSSNTWNKIVVGRNIKIIGIKSPFGFYIENIQVLGANKSPQPTPKNGAAEL